MANWGDLNVALNTLVKAGVITGYKTSRAETGGTGATAIEVSIRTGADQAEVVGRVRELLTGIFSDATVRTKAP